jgi:two-component system response regulator AtoC
MTPHVLLVDDDASLCRLLAAWMSSRGFEVTWRTSGEAALEALQAIEIDAVVADVQMDGMNGFELCEHVVTNHSDVPVLMMTAYGNLDAAVTAIRVGAWDFLTKPTTADALVQAVERAIQMRHLRGAVRRLRQGGAPVGAANAILTASPAMQTVCHLVERVAASDAAVLLTGESGTGKELVARALHAASRRVDGPFVAVNCAALPEALLESEFFGHVRGAFTDAHAARTGLFEQAHGGTLFLDEVAELTPPLQPKLLRVLQEKTVRPLGATTEIPCDVRMIAATNGDLEAAVRAGRFREDLYFRLNVVRLDLPPLRARGEDVLLLAQHFLAHSAGVTGKSVAGISAAAAQLLLRYPWPGNVRELQNCIEHAVVFARYEELVVDDLPEAVRAHLGARGAAAAAFSPLLSLEEVERNHVLRVVESVHGNRTLAAQILNVDRKTLFRKLKAYAADETAAPGEAVGGAQHSS